MINKVTKIIIPALIFFAFLFASAPAIAEDPAPQGQVAAEDVYQEAQRIAAELRCPVCTGQSLVESNSDVAQEMKAKIVEMLREGKSREEIVDHFVSQYGDWILNSPPARGAGLVVWLVPPVALVVGAVIVFRFVRRRQSASRAVKGGDGGPSPAAAPGPDGGLAQDGDLRRKVQDRLRDYL